MVNTALIMINTQESTENMPPHKPINRPLRGLAGVSSAATCSIIAKAGLTLAVPSSLVST
jgi:hypothetical protein